MIPLTLTLKGIYSYQQEHTIDFCKLTGAHLFGIFGPVGSGKSTILEAMTFALYGETERLNSRDNRYHNMKNLRSEELFIRFNFLAGEDLQDEYCFEVSYDARKKSSAFRRTQKVREKGRWVVKELTAEGVLGLSYENFRRTVIIPQGKFQEFLQLGSAERTRMLREIFDLHRFELSDRVKALRIKNDHELANLAGQLQSLGEVDRKAIAALERQLAEGRAVLDRLQNELAALSNREEGFRQLQDLFEKIRRQEVKLAEVAAQQADFWQREERLNAYHYCLEHFKGPLEKWDDLTAQIQQCESDLAQKKTAFAAEKQHLSELTERFDAVKKAFLQRERLLQTAEDLETLQEMRDLEEARARVSAQVAQHRGDVAVQGEKMTEFQQMRQRAIRDLKQRKQTLPAMDEILQVQKWFDQTARLQEQIRDCDSEIDRAAAGLAQIRAGVAQCLNAPAPAGKKEALSRFWLTAQRAEKDLPELLTEMDHSLTELQEAVRQRAGEIHHLRVQAQLAAFAGELKPGRPCPLCGATEHPAPMAGEEPAAKLAGLAAADCLDGERIETLRAAREVLARLLGQRESYLERRQAAEAKRAALCAELETHRRAFCWEGYDPADSAGVERAQAQAEQQRREIDRLEKQIEEADRQMEALRREAGQLKETLNGLQSDLVGIDTKHETLKKRLRHVQEQDYERDDAAQLSEKAGSFRERYRQIEREYQNLEQEKNAVENDLARLEGQIRAAASQLTALQTEKKALDTDLQSRLATAPFDNLEAVQNLLALRLDIAAERRDIEQFRRDKHAAETQLAELKKEAAGRTYDTAAHEQLREEITCCRVQIDEKSRYIGGLEKELETARNNLAKRRELEKQQTALKNRDHNLAILAKMFKASGFVNFVSRIHLIQLCNAANERFRRLTRQQLELELTDDNEFQVRDYLHGGETRSIKTLSGGQTFQASLSLALALADSVRQLSRAPQNFFFLDEGFGTLDRESLRLVFDTLKSLRRENRIVGLISHVEELQEEIDVYLQVENDEQSGSRITASWE